MDPVILSLISGGAGTVLGFALSEVAGLVRERNRKREHKASVRTLLRLEIEQNLARLDEFWKQRILQHDGNEMVLTNFQRRANLIRQPMPAWSNLMWESQAATLPLALTEEEIVGVFKLQAKLERLVTLRTQLAEMLPPLLLEQYDRWNSKATENRPAINNHPVTTSLGETLIIYRGHPNRLGPQLDCFNTLSDHLWTEYNCIINNLLRCNPLAEPAKMALLTSIKRRLSGQKQSPDVS